MGQSVRFQAPWHGLVVLSSTVCVLIMTLASWPSGKTTLPTELTSAVIASTRHHTPLSASPPKPVAAVVAPKTAPLAASKPATKSLAPAPTPVPPAAPISDIAPESACPGQASVAQAATVLACMTRYARLFHGVSIVATNAILASAATAKAGDIVACNDFSHTACGHASNYWLIQKNYPSGCSAENIAQGQPAPGVVFVAWMNSSGHRANILRAGYDDIGVGVQSSSSGPAWVMELGGC